MSTRYSESSHLGDEAINFISDICTKSRQALFLQRPGKDIGIDGHIELLGKNGEPSGAVAFIQSKGGLSCISKTGRYQIKTDKKHFETWSRYKIPVIGIVYNPSLNDARWVSISEHLQSHLDSIRKGPYVIDAPPDQSFSLEGFAKFHSYITTQHIQTGNDPAQILIDQYFSGDIIKKYECLVQLFTAYRWTPLSCFFFHQVLKIEEEPSILNDLTYIISYYRPFAWRLSGTMPEDSVPLRNLAQKCFAGFGKAEILKMLSTIDYENGLNRGSIGWLVAIQLKYIPKIEDILCEIAKDRVLEPQIRGRTITILASFLGYADASFYQSLLEHEDDRFVIETLYWALEWGVDGLEEGIKSERL